MSSYWIFLIPAIVIAIFSDKIDAAANANNKLKRWLILICVLMAITSVVLIVKQM